MASAPSSLLTDSVPEHSLDARNASGYPRVIFDRKEDQDKFSCAFCRNILRDPLQADCGHRFCTPCRDEIKLSQTPVLCSFCKLEGCSDAESTLKAESMYPDRGIDREMSRVKTKCPNEPCGWSGVFRDYKTDHEKNCTSKPRLCEKCGTQVLIMKYDNHLKNHCPKREVTCEFCSLSMPFSEKEKHAKECPKMPQSCLQCNAKVLREKMHKHVNYECLQRNIQCPVDGCSSSLPLASFQDHVAKKTGKHLAYVFAQLEEIDNTLKKLNNDSFSGAAAGPLHKMSGVGQSEALDILKSKIEQLEESVQTIMRQRPLSNGATGGSDGASMGAGAGAESFVSGGSDRINAMEFKVNSLEPILSVLHGEMNRCINAIESLESRLQREVSLALEFRQKIEQYESTIQSMNTAALQRESKIRELENRLANLCQDQPDGTLLWKISEFTKVRNEAIAGNVSNIHSRPFYTGPIGYKMCVRLYPNGDGMGKGTHLSLFFTLMRGNHDALLPWPFKQKVYFMLIDQSFKKHIVDAFRSEPTSSSFQKPTSEMNIATGCPLFMALSKLNQPGHGYLKDDTLYIRVLVEQDGIEDHLKQFNPRTVPLSTAT